MNTLAASFVLGYHGCDRSIAERLIAGEKFSKSENQYDWLGHGIYFWEANPKRGLAFAVEKSQGMRGKDSNVTEPYVVGAVIDLGLCLDMTVQADIDQVRLAFGELEKVHRTAEQALPKNREDGLLRPLDCAVIETLHQIRQNSGQAEINTVRGVFVEGDPIYESAGFREKTHVQICVRDPDCIKGVFRVPEAHLD